MKGIKVIDVGSEIDRDRLTEQEIKKADERLRQFAKEVVE